MAKAEKNMHTRVVRVLDSDPELRPIKPPKPDLPVPNRFHPHWTFYVKLHEIGECPDRAYGEDCDGIGHWEEDPFMAEIRGDHSEHWQCDGVLIGRALDI